MAKITLEKIAKELHVSKVTVFKALNGKEGVSETLRAQIKEKALEMGYVKLRPSNFKFIFAIKENVFLATSEQFYNPIYYQLSKECERSNSSIHMAFIDPSGNNIDNVLSIMNGTDYVSGIFVAGQIGKTGMEKFARLHVPVVFLDYFNPEYNSFHYVYLDNYHLSYCLTNYLISLGHKRIGFVGEVGSTEAITDRYLGYKRALIEAGNDCSEELHINVNIERTDDAAELFPPSAPTAYLCHCDAAAQRLYSVLNLHQLNVPDDVSVISFDNTSLCETLFPKLTSAGMGKDVIAKQGYQAMINAISGNMKKQQLIPIKATFVERDSVKRISE